MLTPCQPHANPMPTPCGRVQKITQEQRKKKKARGRLLFADLFITDPTCSIAGRD
jgi:hypothetical protein